MESHRTVLALDGSTVLTPRTEMSEMRVTCDFKVQQHLKSYTFPKGDLYVAISV